MIKGVISDMDGVMLDTEKLYVRFWCEAANAYGYPMQKEHALGIRSLARQFAVEKLKGWFGEDFDYEAVRNKRIELMNKYVAENGVESKPGADRLLQWLKANNYKIALATATPVDRATVYLEQVGLLHYFDEIVSARMVERGKPEPDIYLYAAGQLRLKPEECIALEDSQNGVRSASAAGCKTVLVPDMDNPEQELKPLLYATAKNLENVIEIVNNT